MEQVRIELLADHPEAVPWLQRLMVSEWDDYYGANGPGDAAADLASYSSRIALPIGMVAIVEGEVCGLAALKKDSIRTHLHLTPWVGAGLVAPALRGRGIGALLLSALEVRARELGYGRIYCATNSANTLLVRAGWQERERVEGLEPGLIVYEKWLAD